MSDEIARFRIDGQVHELDLSKLSMREAEQCEQLTGWTWMQWLKALLEDESRPPRAMAFLLWLAKTRAGEQIKFSDLDFNVFSFEWVDDEPADDADESGDESRPTGRAEVSIEVIESPPAML